MSMKNLWKDDETGEIIAVDPHSRSCECAGASRALFSLRDILMLIHSPIGCQINLIWNHYFRGRLPRWCSTDLSEPEVVYGGEEKLEAAIKKADKVYRPKAIIVLSACVPELIGDDIEGVVKRAQEEVDAQVFSVRLVGFRGDHHSGYQKMTKEVIKRYARPGSEVVKKSVNLVGLMMDEYRAEGDVIELQNLLQEIGIKVNCILMGESSIEDLKRVPQAELNIVISRVDGLAIAQDLKERFGTPFIAPWPPYGVKGTSEWLREVASFFHREDEAQQIIQRQEDRTYADLGGAFFALSMIPGLPFCIAGHPTCVAGISRCLAKEFSCQPLVLMTSGGELAEDLLKSLMEDLGELPLKPTLLVDPGTWEVEKALISSMSVNRQLGLGDSYPLYMGSSTEKLMLEQHFLHNPGKMMLPFLRVSFPIYGSVEITKTPFMGYRGALHLVEEVCNEAHKLLFPRSAWKAEWILKGLGPECR